MRPPAGGDLVCLPASGAGGLESVRQVEATVGRVDAPSSRAGGGRGAADATGGQAGPGLPRAGGVEVAPSGGWRAAKGLPAQTGVEGRSAARPVASGTTRSSPRRRGRAATRSCTGAVRSAPSSRAGGVEAARRTRPRRDSDLTLPRAGGTSEVVSLGAVLPPCSVPSRTRGVEAGPVIFLAVTDASLPHAKRVEDGSAAADRVGSTSSPRTRGSRSVTRGESRRSPPRASGALTTAASSLRP